MDYIQEHTREEFESGKFEKLNNGSYRRTFWRWMQYFRESYSMYFGMIFALSNFIILIYNFVILKYGIWDIGMIQFGLIITIPFFIINIIVGYLHYKNTPFEQIAIVGWDNNPRRVELMNRVKNIEEMLK